MAAGWTNIDNPLFGLDGLLPSQVRPPRSWTPEQRLLIAMLSRAVKDYRHGLVDDWFVSDDETPFSFRFVCDHLGLSADRVRESL